MPRSVEGRSSSRGVGSSLQRGKAAEELLAGRAVKLQIGDWKIRVRMIRKALYVTIFALPVAFIGVVALRYRLPIGPVILGLTLIPIVGLLVAKRSFVRAIPDIIFGAIDTGLLTVPALWGGILFGVAGAIAGGVIGDALTDGIAGFFEGSIAEWLRKRGIEESREAVTTAQGKMAGCLFGSGAVLTIALLIGIRPKFG